jgi:hypothetical protein
VSTENEAEAGAKTTVMVVLSLSEEAAQALNRFAFDGSCSMSHVVEHLLMGDVTVRAGEMFLCEDFVAAAGIVVGTTEDT